MRPSLAGAAAVLLFLFPGTIALGSPSGDADGRTPADAWTVPVDAVASFPLPHPAGPGLPDADQTEPIPTDWRVLLGLNYVTGEMSQALHDRAGKRVSIPGFMVPFEDGLTGVNEFLLVPYFGACIHTPPPPPNQLVYVRMEGGQTVDVNIWDAVVLEGVLEVAPIESPYGSVGHQVLGQALGPYRRTR